MTVESVVRECHAEGAAWQEVQGLKFHSAAVCAVKPGAESVVSSCCPGE